MKLFSAAFPGITIVFTIVMIFVFIYISFNEENESKKSAIYTVVAVTIIGLLVIIPHSINTGSISIFNNDVSVPNNMIVLGSQWIPADNLSVKDGVEILSVDGVDTSKEGKNTITVKYLKGNIEKTKNLTLNILDLRKPILSLSMKDSANDHGYNSSSSLMNLKDMTETFNVPVGFNLSDHLYVTSRYYNNDEQIIYRITPDIDSVNTDEPGIHEFTIRTYTKSGINQRIKAKVIVGGGY